jgi:hypothetical protein
MRQFFEQLVRVTDDVIGPHMSEDARGEWPDPESTGVTSYNTEEWVWHGNDVFARWFEKSDEMELLVVITAVDPFVDFTDTLDRVSETLPDNIEIELSASEAGSPVLIALTFDGYSDLADEELRTELVEFLALARKISDQVSA